jgi:hypothetical protein
MVACRALESTLAELHQREQRLVDRSGNAPLGAASNDEPVQRVDLRALPVGRSAQERPRVATNVGGWPMLTDVTTTIPKAARRTATRQGGTQDSFISRGVLRQIRDGRHVTRSLSIRAGVAGREVIVLVRRDTRGGFLEIVSSGGGMYLSDLPPCTTLRIWTLHSLYRMVIKQAPEVSVQGGVFFPAPTAARLVGSSWVSGGLLEVGWIGAGLRVELRSTDQYVVTSPVRAITRTDPPAAGRRNACALRR